MKWKEVNGVISHRVVELGPPASNRVDDEPLEMVVDCLLGKTKLEALAEVLGRLIAERLEAIELGV